MTGVQTCALPICETGETGNKGENGATGAQGVQGAQGIQGGTGAQGAQGVQGEAGQDGETDAYNTTPAPTTPAPTSVWGQSQAYAGASCMDLYSKGVRKSGDFYLKSAMPTLPIPTYDYIGRFHGTAFSDGSAATATRCRRSPRSGTTTSARRPRLPSRAGP